jgi:hypothetical protein
MEDRGIYEVTNLQPDDLADVCGARDAVLPAC